MTSSEKSKQEESWLKPPNNFIIPSERPKREPGPVEFETLSEEQRIAADEIINFVESKDRSTLYYTLKGFAGTGKTYIVSKLQEYFIYHKRYDLAVTAPTHKAVKVLREMSDIESKSLIFKTIYSLLGLRLSHDKMGNVEFTASKTESNRMDRINVLFIDEVSMLDRILFIKHIHPYVSESSYIKVIFIGDPAQIPPVGHNECIPFLPTSKDKYKIKEVCLTEIRRQALGNPILELATHIRNNLSSKDDTFKYETSIVNNEGVIIIDKDNRELLYQICENYFKNDYFHKYSDFMKVIAWRNITVNAINKKVRELIYGKENLPMLLVGEKLIADEAIVKTSSFGSVEVIYNTNDEFEVADLIIRETDCKLRLLDGPITKKTLKYYEATVFTVVDNKKFHNVIRIIHEDSSAIYKNILNDLRTRIMLMHWEARGAGWKMYFTYKDTWAEVKYNYAITAHKAQGSTYENCMIINWDMKINNRFEEANRIRYVASTRARNKLFIIN